MSKRWKPRRRHDFHPNKKLSQEDLDRLWDLLDSGMTQKAAGAVFGICQQRVSQLMRWYREKEFQHFYPKSKFFKELCKRDAGWVPGQDEED